MSDMPRYRQNEWISDQQISLDSSRMMAAKIGEAHGISVSQWEAIRGRVAAAHQTLSDARTAGSLPFFDLPTQDTGAIHQMADRVRARYKNFVVVGIGGSSLGPKATHNCLSPRHYNLLPDDQRDGPRFFLLENADPDSSAELLELLDPSETCINVVSKSGGTAETAANMLLATEWLDKGGADLTQQVIATTDPADGNLRKLAEREGWQTLPIPPKVGGRFSQLTGVGLLPAAVCGIDIDELLAGAAHMEARTRTADLEQNLAYRFAAVHYLADTQKQKPICVVMPYSDALSAMADWFVQLWAESLGKAYDRQGKVVNTGQTPLAAVGAIDQHSQVQLFVEGPADKMVTFLRVGEFTHQCALPDRYGDLDSFSYLGGQTMADLLGYEQAATEMVLTDLQRPSMRIDLPRLNPFVLGQLFYFYEVATAFAGGLYDIDPFDQPGVELGKVLTYGAMGREGFENRLAD